MTGRLFLTSPMSALAAALEVPVGALVDEPPRANVAPGQQIVTLTHDRLCHMRWGIIPVGRVNARGRPVMETIVNVRSETVFDKTAFAGTGRAVVPVDGWYEWTGEKRRKTAWRITPKGGGFLYFAAITDLWRAPGGMEVAQVATLTCPPNGDVAPVHHRMPVLLEKEQIGTWLTGTAGAVDPLLRPWPEGSLDILEARGGDWTAP
ncbi:DUF159 family protein [Sulfitobacter alexandrii]|uniref:Abasic site processing protein n=1 Tax=Sulfitobacter alexandrii TaxID=1917485 RepID=A0A1J0WKE2_9RHOB|nr:SOS response-associated peptidase [Sulfitobacter alexandrii]APE44648.1 DUF159 family protein [Sulfitobacter alexandrii]